MTDHRYILMLENDAHDRELSRDYFKSEMIPFEFLTLSSEVVPFLDSAIKNNRLPAIILLSMNAMPENGYQVLQKLKSSPLYKHIPVIILGENTQAELIRKCYQEGVSTFINKPLKQDLIDKTIRNFLHYWFNVAELPRDATIVIDAPLIN